MPSRLAVSDLGRGMTGDAGAVPVPVPAPVPVPRDRLLSVAAGGTCDGRREFPVRGSLASSVRTTERSMVRL